MYLDNNNSNVSIGTNAPVRSRLNAYRYDRDDGPENNHSTERRNRADG